MLQAILASLLRKRNSHGWKPFLRDPWCQFRAEIIACEILTNYYRDKKWQLRDEQYKLDRPGSPEELKIEKGRSLFIAKDVTRVGLVALPADCEVRAVLVTSKRS